jgi:hypothetical protein
MQEPVEVYEEKRHRLLTKIVPCPTCGRQFSVTYNPESPYLEEAKRPELARVDLRAECPKHGPRGRGGLLYDRALIASIRMLRRAWSLIVRLIR